MTNIKPSTEVPLFMDCAWADILPSNGSETSPVLPPPNLTGGGLANAPSGTEHWRMLLNRHPNYSINICMADGSARPVQLQDLYKLTWKKGWKPYTLPGLPRK